LEHRLRRRPGPGTDGSAAAQPRRAGSRRRASGPRRTWWRSLGPRRGRALGTGGRSAGQGAPKGPRGCEQHRGWRRDLPRTGRTALLPTDRCTAAGPPDQPAPCGCAPQGAVPEGQSAGLGKSSVDAQAAHGLAGTPDVSPCRDARSRSASPADLDGGGGGATAKRRGLREIIGRRAAPRGPAGGGMRVAARVVGAARGHRPARQAGVRARQGAAGHTDRAGMA